MLEALAKTYESNVMKDPVTISGDIPADAFVSPNIRVIKQFMPADTWIMCHVDLMGEPDSETDFQFQGAKVC